MRRWFKAVKPTSLKALSLVLAVLAGPAWAEEGDEPAVAEAPVAVTPEQVAATVKATLEELAGNSDPAVRRVVFEGLLALGETSRALAAGLEDSDLGLKGRALTFALTTPLAKDQAKLKEDARKALAKLLESGEAEERQAALAVVEGLSAADRLPLFQTAAKQGAPEARAAARAWLIAQGGETAFAVIQAGLAEPESEPEHGEALKALDAFTSPVALKWALDHLLTAGELGRAARDLFVRLPVDKATQKAEADLRKRYQKSVDFDERLRIAMVLSLRGDQDPEVSKTLHAGVTPRYQDQDGRLIAWKGLAGVKDLALLGKVRATILTNSRDQEAELAYAWLVRWAKASGEPKVFEVLQDAAKGDRRPLRLRGLDALATLGHRPSKALFEGAMTEGQKEIRLAAARGLAAVSQPGDERKIAEFLRREPEVEVKVQLVKALGHIGTPETIDFLQFVVTAPQMELKREALVAVAATGQPKAAVLLGLLKRDPDLDLRFDAWRQLLLLEPRKTEAEFKSTLGWLLPKQIKALGDERRVDAALLELIAREGEPGQRKAAVEALEARGNDGATRLLGLLDCPHADVATGALSTLARLRGAESVPTYRKGLESPHAGVRAVAYASIGLYGPPALLEAALSGQADKDPLVRVQATVAALRLAEKALAETKPARGRRTPRTR